MRLPWGSTLPNIDPNGYWTTSEPNEAYNCIAWAAGETDRWWSHVEPYYWPSNVDRAATIEALVSAFASIGYEECDTSGLEYGYEKIALFAINGLWSHAARQLEDGTWTSKLGIFQDIEHVALNGLCGDFYGEIFCIMRRGKSE